MKRGLAPQLYGLWDAAFLKVVVRNVELDIRHLRTVSCGGD